MTFLSSSGPGLVQVRVRKVIVRISPAQRTQRFGPEKSESNRNVFSYIQSEPKMSPFVYIL